MRNLEMYRNKKKYLLKIAYNYNNKIYIYIYMISNNFTLLLINYNDY